VYKGDFTVIDIAENILSETRLFADDSSLSVSSNDLNYIESTLNSDLEKINKCLNNG
jgi:hypothetical protein